MERQLTVRVSDGLARKLTQAARQMRRKRSEVVRLALEDFLAGTGERVSERPITLVRDLIGAVESGVPDLGQRHREYLLGRMRRGR